MIVVGGGGGWFLLVALLLMAAFVLVPLLVFRSAARSVVLADPAWQPVPPSGWDVPDSPVLPPVSAADVVSLRDRLGHDVRLLDPGGDPVARQAMADAAERLSTCVTLLERSSSQAQLRTAWLAAVEGLHATRLVRGRLGLDLGPEPPLPPTGPRLTSDARLDVDGRAYAGGPSYAPGRPHWFPGGHYGGRWVPGGWYDAPFWPAGLVLGGLGGLALGGLAGAVFADELDGGRDDGGFGDGGFGGGGFGGGGWGDDARFDGFGDGGFGGGGWGGGDGGGFGGGDSGGGDW